VRLEARIEELAERYKAGQDVPLRIKLWNGSHVDLSSDPRVTITLTTPAAALQLLRPNLSVLGEAYIEGKIELEGPIGEVIRAGV
jgi:cyclopropane-fatty-acyl-phospholipid synthase